MSDYAILSADFSALRSAAHIPIQRCIREGEVAVFEKEKGRLIECNSGFLWVTMERENEDYVLVGSDRIRIPNQGKVLVSGKGCFQIA